MQAQAYVDDEHSLQLLLRWTSAFSRSLMWHVREECDLEAEMQVPHMVLLAHYICTLHVVVATGLAGYYSNAIGPPLVMS